VAREPGIKHSLQELRRLILTADAVIAGIDIGNHLVNPTRWRLPWLQVQAVHLAAVACESADVEPGLGLELALDLCPVGRGLLGSANFNRALERFLVDWVELFAFIVNWRRHSRLPALRARSTRRSRAWSSAPWVSALAAPTAVAVRASGAHEWRRGRRRTRGLASRPPPGRLAASQRRLARRSP